MAAALALMSLCAAAQGLQLSPKAVPTPQLVKHSLAAAKATPEPATARPLRAKARKALNLPSTASAIERDYAWSTGKMTSRGAVTGVLNQDGSVTVYNLLGLADTLQATFDVTTMTVSLTPKVVYHSAAYGDVWACSISVTADGKLQPSTTAPITGTINAQEGTVTLRNWAAIVPSGKYIGYGFGIFSKSDFIPTNATMTEVLNHSGTDSTVTYPVLLEQTYTNQLQVSNFVNTYGASVSLRLNADKSVEIVPQRIFTNAMYGDFMCYRTDWASGKLISGNIPATGTATAISWGNWAVLDRGTHSLLARRVMSSHIDFADGLVTYPAAPTLTWTGDGTEASPYVITTAQQLADLAESVAAGNSYTGKYICLGNNIDLSTLQQAYRPVGASKDKAFNGIFDGKGYTISGLNLTAGEEDCQGIFGYADSTSVIKNIKLSDITLSTYGEAAGALVGFSSGTVTGITATGINVTSQSPMAGGIIGDYRGLNLSDVSFTGQVTGVGSTGGIAGCLRGGNMSRCQSHGQVAMTGLYDNAYRGLGGLVGSTLPYFKQLPLITDCYSDATVADATGFGATGGVVGSLLTGTLQRSFNAGQISSKAAGANPFSTAPLGAVGGVVGLIYGGSMRDCYNANIIVNTGASERVGGVIGYTVAPNITMNTKGDTLAVTYQSYIKNCMNFGQVHLPSVTATMGLYGKLYADSVITNCYFDRQLTGNDMPASGKRWAKETAELTSGTAPAGISTSVWQMEAGRYPRLKSMADNASALLGALPATLATGETTRKVKHGFPLTVAGDVVWQAYDATSKQGVSETNGITIVSGDSVALKDTNSSEILMATSAAAGITKLINIETVNPAGFLGSGTEDDPYLITDPDDLRALNTGISKNKQTYKGDFFLQTNDISLAEAPDFKGIGPAASKTLSFAGTYDGGGHRIKDFVIDSVGLDAKTGRAIFKGSRNNVGFFGYIAQTGTVKNLVLDASCSLTGYQYVGAIAGHNDGTIQGCRNYATVRSASSYSGGIVGYNAATGTITSCYNAGRAITGGNNVGGIVGYNYGAVLSCQNDGQVLADSTVAYDRGGTQKGAAGISAMNAGASARIVGCLNTGSIWANDRVGGISTALTTNGNDFMQNINYGTVEYNAPSSDTRGALLTSASYLSQSQANYYDAQLGWYGAAQMAPGAGLNGLTTKELTSGKPLEGIDTAIVDFQAGSYPVLKAFATEPAAQAHRRMIVTFADGETADDMRSAATITKVDGQSALLTRGVFEISGDTLLPRDIPSTNPSIRDSLLLVNGAYSKLIPLRMIWLLFAGEGTEADPFQIKSPADMIALAYYTNEEQYAFTGRFFKVMNDIDFDSVAYTPVAVLSHRLDADFNGDGHKFTNVTYTLPEKSTMGYHGLFGNIGPNGCLHDLTLESGTITTYNGAAGFVGRLWGTGRNLVNKATVTTGSTSTAGGIAASVKYGGSLINCTNMGQVKANRGSNGCIAYSTDAGALIDSCQNLASITTTTGGLAGIVFSNRGTVSNCVNRGNLISTGNLAGIVSSDIAGTFTDCANYGNLGNGSQSNVGGIMATNTQSQKALTTMERCNNYGEINAKAYAGGIVALNYGNSVMRDCHNTASVTTTSGNYAAGIVAYLNCTTARTALISNVTNSGAIVGGNDRTGGIVGELNDGGVVEYAVNTGSVLGTGEFTGGIVGDMTGRLYRCYNVGNVESSSYAIGGLSGINYGEIRECFNAGNVSSDMASSPSTSLAGGIAAYSIGTYYGVYNLGNVTGYSHTGGIVGRTYRDTRISNVYNAGLVTTKTTTLVGNIGSWNTAGFVTNNLYYDKLLNPTLPTEGDHSLDAHAKGLTTRELTTQAELTDTFTLRQGMYPTLTAFNDDPLANFFAATVVLNDGDTYDHVHATFLVGTPDSTVWTWTPAQNLSLGNDGTVYCRQLGKVTLTKTFGAYTRSYELNVDQISGVSDLTADKAVIARDYYTVGGLSLGSVKPQAPGIYVEVTRYQGGTTKSTKIVIR